MDFAFRKWSPRDDWLPAISILGSTRHPTCQQTLSFGYRAILPKKINRGLDSQRPRFSDEVDPMGFMKFLCLSLADAIMRRPIESNGPRRPLPAQTFDPMPQSLKESLPRGSQTNCRAAQASQCERSTHV